MKFNKFDTAVVIIDPQNDFLSEKGANWDAVGDSVTQNGMIGNIERLFKITKANGYEVFISPSTHPSPLGFEGGLIPRLFFFMSNFLFYLCWQNNIKAQARSSRTHPSVPLHEPWPLH